MFVDTVKKRKRMISRKFTIVVTLGEMKEGKYDQGGIHWDCR